MLKSLSNRSPIFGPHIVFRRMLLLVLTVTTLFLFSNRPAQASATPIVFLLHGFSGNCSGSFADADTYLKGKGLTVVNLGYYTTDSGCDSSLMGNYGPTNYNGIANCPAQDTSSAQAADKQKTINTSYTIEKLGYHLAWYIYLNYTINGQPVDFLAHSMGGLIIRSAVAQTLSQAVSGCSKHVATAAGLGPLPPKLLISRVATISTPHDGTTLAALDVTSPQALEMRPGSVFLEDLATEDVTGDAQWLTIGENCTLLSNSDGVVSAMSASWPDGVGAIEHVTYDTCKWVHTNITLDTNETMDQIATIAPEGSAASAGVVHTGCYRPVALSNDWFENGGVAECSN
jgi:hypothetical protein